MTQSSPDQTKKPRSWLKAVLVVSVSLNLLILGFVLGAIVRGYDGNDRRDNAVRELGRSPFVAALEPDTRVRLAQRMREQGTDRGASREVMRAKFEEVLDALRSDNFDRAELERLLAEQRGFVTSRVNLAESALLDALEGMSVDERKSYANRLDRSLRRRP